MGINPSSLLAGVSIGVTPSLPHVPINRLYHAEAIAMVSAAQAATSGMTLDPMVMTLAKYGMVAGSSVAAMYGTFKPNDYDVFFRNGQEFSKAASAIMSNVDGMFDGYRLADNVDASSEQAMLESVNKLNTMNFIHRTEKPIQLIKTHFHHDVESLLLSFDIRLSQFAAFEDSIFMNPLAVADVLLKRLSISALRNNSYNTLTRLLKYGARGFSIPHETVAVLSGNLPSEEGGMVSLTEDTNYG